MLLSLFSTTASGLALYGADQWQGPLAGLLKDTSEFWVHILEETHEFFANFSLILVIVHIGGVIWESLLHGENLVKAMINGRKHG
jgi:cytochrome b